MLWKQHGGWSWECREWASERQPGIWPHVLGKDLDLVQRDRICLEDPEQGVLGSDSVFRESLLSCGEWCVEHKGGHWEASEEPSHYSWEEKWWLGLV